MIAQGLVIRFDAHHFRQGAESGRGQNAAGAESGSHGEVHRGLDFDSAAHACQNLRQRDLRVEQAGHLQSGPGNCKGIAGTGRLQDFLAGTVLGDAGFARGVTAQDRFVQPPDRRPDGIAAIEQNADIQDSTAPVETKRRGVGPAAPQIDAGGTFDGHFRMLPGCCAELFVHIAARLYRALDEMKSCLVCLAGFLREAGLPKEKAGGVVAAGRLGGSRGLQFRSLGTQAIAGFRQRPDSRRMGQQRPDIGAGGGQREGQCAPVRFQAPRMGGFERHAVRPLGARSQREPLLCVPPLDGVVGRRRATATARRPRLLPL